MSTLLAQLAWRDAHWLWLALCPWALWLLHALPKRRRGSDYADPQLLPWARAQRVLHGARGLTWRRLAIALAWLLFAMALAGPRLPLGMYGQDQSHYTQLLVVLDMSRSMTARDITPSRLARAKLALEQLLNREDRLKIGLVVYAAHPHLMIPPTADKTVLRHALHLLHYGLLPTAGSNLPQALAFAARQFTSPDAAHALLLVSDGGLPRKSATLQQRLDDSVARLAEKGIRLYALGVGTRHGAPLQAADGTWLHYAGRPVISRLHARRLRRLAQIGNGVYARLSDSDADWQTLYDDAIRYLGVHDSGRGASGLVQWHELYPWCLVPGVLFLLLGYITPPARRRSSSVAPSLLWLALFTGALSLQPGVVHAAGGNPQRRAFLAYQGHHWQAALQAYAQVRGYAGRMGEGSSAYRLGRFNQAARQFIQAVLAADTDAQRASAIFNLANCRYRQQAYAKAAALYRQTLRYAPRDPAARVNLDWALDQLRRRTRTAQHDGGAHQGRGPRSVRAAPGKTVAGKLSLDQQRPKKAPLAAAPAHTGPSADTAAHALRESQPLVDRLVEFRHPDWHYATTSPTRIVLQANALRTDQGLLWKRIFIGQEGLPPAPVPQPIKQPGVRPW